MDEVAGIIKRKMRLMIVDGVKYEKIGMMSFMLKSYLKLRS